MKRCRAEVIGDVTDEEAIKTVVSYAAAGFGFDVGVDEDNECRLLLGEVDGFGLVAGEAAVIADLPVETPKSRVPAGLLS